MTVKTRSRRMDLASKSWQDSLTFTVSGPGAFPVDMLRFDQAVPNTGEDASSITNSLAMFGEFPKTVRTITLRSLKTPTVDRWQSFGWRVECECTEVRGSSKWCPAHMG